LCLVIPEPNRLGGFASGLALTSDVKQKNVDHESLRRYGGGYPLMQEGKGLARGNLADAQIRGILGENWLRIAGRVWRFSRHEAIIMGSRLIGPPPPYYPTCRVHELAVIDRQPGMSKEAMDGWGHPRGHVTGSLRRGRQIISHLALRIRWLPGPPTRSDSGARMVDLHLGWRIYVTAEAAAAIASYTTVRSSSVTQ
jgi:hypothetical protein